MPNTNLIDYRELEGLTDAEKEAVLQILGEVSMSGSSSFLSELKYADYNEIPVDIETFLTDDRYLGKAWKDASGKSKLYPFWLEQLKKLFPTNIDTDYNTFLESGARGIGKSEAALELIKRGHRLVTDDVVELRRVSDDTLIGSAPDITKHFIELRGIGIIDVKALFGASSVKDTQSIDLVIRLEDWDKDKEYDRLGLEEEYTEYLGNKVVCHNIPIRPGRNLAVICESAAVNHRQKKMGYNAAQELYKRVQNSLAQKRDEDEEEQNAGDK